MPPRVDMGARLSLIRREKAQRPLLPFRERAPPLNSRGLEGVEEVLRLKGQVGPVHASRMVSTAPAWRFCHGAYSKIITATVCANI